MSPISQISWRRAGLHAAALLLVVMTFGAARCAVGQQVAIYASVDQTIVRVGRPFFYTLTVAVQGNAGLPSLPKPEFGRLNVMGAPSSSTGSAIRNGARSSSRTLTYQLRAPAEGVYKIEPAALRYGNQTYQTKAFRIEAIKSGGSRLPKSMRAEPIVENVTRDRQRNEYFRGRIFVQPVLSTPEPYVGQSTVFSLYLYCDPELLPPGTGLPEPAIAPPSPSDVTVRWDPELKASARSVEIDGRIYWKKLIYRAFLTPQSAGAKPFSDYGAQLNIHERVRTARSNQGRWRRVSITLRGGRMAIIAQPLPRPVPGVHFSGTVGAAEITATFDQDNPTMDDLITLTVIIEGRISPEMIATPVVPRSEHFELFDQSEKIEIESDPDRIDGLIGRRTLEYILQPLRAGTFQIALEPYVIFNPAKGEYETLRPGPLTLTIAPGVETVAAGGPGVPASLLPDRTEAYEYIRPAESFEHAPPRLIVEHPLFWLLQICAAAMAGASFARTRKRERSDPAELRRLGASAALGKKLKRIASASGSKTGDAEATAMELERAVREFVADWRGISADGLTIDAVAAALSDGGIDADKIEGLRQIMSACANIRFTPVPPGGYPFGEWSDQIRSVLGEVVL